MGTRLRLFLAVLAVACAVAAPSGAARAAETVEHLVRPGDNLHLIAGYYYKDPRQWKRVWRENRGKLRRANLLHPGAALRVPLSPGSGWEIPYEEFLSRAGSR